MKNNNPSRCDELRAELAFQKRLKYAVSIHTAPADNARHGYLLFASGIAYAGDVILSEVYGSEMGMSPVIASAISFGLVGITAAAFDMYCSHVYDDARMAGESSADAVREGDSMQTRSLAAEAETTKKSYRKTVRSLIVFAVATLLVAGFAWALQRSE